MSKRVYDFLYEPKTYEEIPCQFNCPVHTDVEGYIHLIRDGRWADAHALIRETNPFPSVCGRVCQHPCETDCSRGSVDEAVSIRTLKRAATDFSYDDIIPPPRTYPTLEKVAIIGAGPAGLTVAYDLARLGYRVTVFEAEKHPGGMLRYGIPAFRLPRETIDKEIEFIRMAGVDIRCDTRIGRDITLPALKNEYKAVIIAAGAWKPATLGIPGEDLEGVYHGVDFLYKVNSGGAIPLIGKKVAVIGGGFTAMDVSRSALRLGAKEASVVYRRTKDEIPVTHEELEDTIDEGVKLHYLVAPLDIVSDDGKTVSGIRLIKNKLGEPDDSGRRRPVPIEGSEFIMKCDIVVPAVSQYPLPDSIENQKDITLDKWDNIKIDKNTLMSDVPGVFACGDFLWGTRHVIEVIGEAHKTSVAVDSFLRGEPAEKTDKRRNNFTLNDYDEPQDKALRYDDIPRAHNPMMDNKVRSKTFAEAETGFTRDQAIREAGRCLQCNYLWTYLPELCIMCQNCVDVCPQSCLSIAQLSELQHNRWLNEGIGLNEQGVTGIEIDRDLCIRCAFCKDVCPTDSITFSCFASKVEALKA